MVKEKQQKVTYSDGYNIIKESTWTTHNSTARNVSSTITIRLQEVSVRTQTLRVLLIRIAGLVFGLR